MTVSSAIDICNIALDHLGKTSIASLTEGSNEARKCALHYPQARQSALAFSNWTFARKSRLLSALSDNDFSDVWGYAYDIPNDAITPRRVCGAGAMPNWNSAPPPAYVERGVIYTNVPNARLFYTWDTTNTLQWSSLFVDALALTLASRLAYSLTRKKGDAEDFHQKYLRGVSKAVEHDAVGETTTYRFGDGYADARHGGSDLPRTSYDGSSFWGDA